MTENTNDFLGLTSTQLHRTREHNNRPGLHHIIYRHIRLLYIRNIAMRLALYTQPGSNRDDIRPDILGNRMGRVDDYGPTVNQRTRNQRNPVTKNQER